MTSNSDISERYSRLQHPLASEKDEEVRTNLVAWERARRDLKALDPTMQGMPQKFQMEAIKCILPFSSKLRDYIDEREDDLDTYEKLRNAIMTWGLRKKEAENREQTAMDVGSVGDPPLKQARYNNDN